MPAPTKLKVADLRTAPLGAAPWVRLGNSQRAIPTRFEATALLVEPECRVSLLVDASNGVPLVDLATVARTGAAVSGVTMRKLALDALVRQAVDQVAEPIETVRVEGRAGSWRLARDADVAHTGRPRRPPGARDAPRQAITDEILQRVAAVYRSAERAPTQAVANELCVSRSHAGRLVMQARAAGHLGSTTPGRATA